MDLFGYVVEDAVPVIGRRVLDELFASLDIDRRRAVVFIQHQNLIEKIEGLFPFSLSVFLKTSLKDFKDFQFLIVDFFFGIYQFIDLYRLGFSFDPDNVELPGNDSVLSGPECFFADDDGGVVILIDSLETGGEIHGIPNDGVIHPCP